MKKKENETPPEIDFVVKGEDLWFSADGALKFRMKSARVLELLDRNRVRQEIAALQELQPSDEYAGIDSLALFARIQRLLQKGFTTDETAGFLEMKPEVVRGYLSFGISKYRKGRDQLAAEIRRQAIEGGDYCLKIQRRQTEQERARGWVPEPEHELIPTAKVKDMLKQGQGINEIARTFELDEKSFAEWLKLNEALLAY